jgi:hypothetical protein
MFVDVKTMAARYKLAAKTIYREIQMGRLEVIKIGKANTKRAVYRVTEEAISAWEKNHTQGVQK